jgi:hypothetical protein
VFCTCAGDDSPYLIVAPIDGNHEARLSLTAFQTDTRSHERIRKGFAGVFRQAT